MSADFEVPKVTWPFVPLAEVCDIIIGRTPSRNRPEFWRGDLPWLSIADMNKGREVRSTKERITALGATESGSRLIHAGTVVLSFKLSIGKVAITKIATFTNEAIAALPILQPERLDHNFLFWTLQSIRLDEEVDVAAKGKTLNKEKLQRLQIPLPPLDEQKRIAAVLDKADALRRQRQESLQLTEKLLQSVFIDMFGDPVRNTENLPTADLSNLAKLERGKFTPRPRNDPSYFGGPYPFIQTGDITRSGGRITRWTQTLNEKGAGVSKEFGRGTVVIAIVGATLGETAIVETPVYCPDSIIGITPFPNKATPEFIEFLLRFWKPRLKELAPDAARANLNLERLRPLAAIAPRFEEQTKFSRIAKHLRELALTKFENEHQLNRLFSSLQQRAFRGELDLSRLVIDCTSDEVLTNDPLMGQGLTSRLDRLINYHGSRQPDPFDRIDLFPHWAFPAPKAETRPDPIISLFKKQPTSVLGMTIAPLIEAPLAAPASFEQIVQASKQGFTTAIQAYERALPSTPPNLYNPLTDTIETGGAELEPEEYETLKAAIFSNLQKGTLMQEFHQGQNEIVFRPTE